MTNSIRVLQVLCSLDVRTGGPQHSIKNQVENLNSIGLKTDIWTFNYPYKDGHFFFKTEAKHHIAKDFLLSRLLGSWSPWAKKGLIGISRHYDVIHNHGHWLYGNYCARLVASEMRKPLIISPRGMLESWALESKKFKKKIAWKFYEKRNLECADVFHATSYLEAASIRKLGFKQPIAIIPNGVDVPIYQDIAAAVPMKKKNKTILFLSRIDPKKGLDRLISIWERQEENFSDWKLIIAGDGERGYTNYLQKIINSKKLTHRIEWVGFACGKKKKKLYQEASVFVFPSFSENFGNVVGEALSFGLPVITTNGTPWDDIVSEQCGWFVDNSENAIELGIIHALRKTSGELAKMGQRGRLLVERKYSWKKIATQFDEMYRWVHDKTKSCPGFFEID